MILPDLIGKLLAFAAAIMDNYVSVVTHQSLAANCSPGLTVPVVALLPCGWTVASMSQALDEIENLVEFSLLAALSVSS